ncbi:sensor histidine kinase [Chryseosolibacter indicus]|uniref:histidine kinase n=1 Tax=Chryseosolibacter indicus TaxID=2782351 RepID=A0ABS5VKB8_9BACT|nr:HAMP domain-containing sensor histidine kinase [Chryseosolibacter indicus]MBT1701890.1 HAMP domain-containing histidine kinase [Chryseosolibacter indicus]
MNYKKRLILLFVGLFLFVLTAILSFIYISYADFRREEFFERLREKSFSTVKLLAEVNEIDRDLLKIIDRNTINKMYDEKVLVFNEKNELIYSSLDDETIPYSTSFIEQIRDKEDKFYVDEDGDEVVGVHYRERGNDYVVLASAYDQYGISKLKNLRNLVIGALLAGTFLIALSSYFYIHQIFYPIDQLNKSIQVISESNLREFVNVTKNRDELDELAVNYNQMLGRLFKAFESQRSFVRNASHELKTPLALIHGKLEKLQDLHSADRQAYQIINSIMEDVQGQASLVESLLLMQRLQSELPIHKTSIRIDEILDKSVAEEKERFPALHVEVDIAESITSDKQLVVVGNDMLMKVCLKNLIRNAALYSETDTLLIKILFENESLIVLFSNKGFEELPKEIFEPFYRQSKQQEKPGSGLGLSLVAQIMNTLHGSVSYTFINEDHIFRLSFPFIKI